MVTKAKTKVKKEEKEAPLRAVRPALTSFIETDCVGFDLAISNGQGLPEGGNILLFAPPATGKSTLIADVVRRLLVKHEQAGLPFRVVYLDSENSITLLNCIGKDPKNKLDEGLEKYISIVPANGAIEYKPQQLIYYSNIHSFKETEDIFSRYVVEDNVKENQDIKLIIVDSLTNLVSTTLLEADVDKADYGSNAKERTRFYGKWQHQTRGKNITVIYTSQMRQKQNASAYEDPLRAAVTKADEHNMDVIAKLTKSTDSKRIPLKKVKQKTIDGEIEKQTRYILKITTSKAAGTKNRIWDAVDVECLVRPGFKILNAYTLFNLLFEIGFYKKVNNVSYAISDQFKAGLPDVDFGDQENYTKKELNQLTSRNMGKIVEYLKVNGLYKATIGDIEELDDGIEC